MKNFAKNNGFFKFERLRPYTYIYKSEKNWKTIFKKNC